MKTKKSFLIGSLLIIGLVFSSCKNQNKQDINSISNNAEVAVETLSDAAEVARVESSKVCYVNNKFMGIEQIPVDFENKTYYGCCEGCVVKLKTMRESRYAIDPSTGKEVDKALAFIVLSPSGNNDVLYFESEESYIEYIKS
jgi:hypothetical protein